MTRRDRHGGACLDGGFVLVLVLVLTSVLLIGVLGVVSLTHADRRANRRWVDQSRAMLAVTAGYEAAGKSLLDEASNDDFLVIESLRADPPAAGRRQRTYAFMARPVAVGASWGFRYVPLFTSRQKFATSQFVRPPIMAADPAMPPSRWQTHPWLDPVKVDWLPVTDPDGVVVARHAYWIEDLQGMIDPLVAGNPRGTDGVHKRVVYPFPCAGVAGDVSPPADAAADQIAWYALDASADDGRQGALMSQVFSHRPLLVSPESSLAAAGVRPPLERLTTAAHGRFAGELLDVTASRIERSLVACMQPYIEQPLVPWLPGIAPEVVGQPKRNLNNLLAGQRKQALQEMTDWVGTALPEFENRRGGFGGDYLTVLAANALDYADADGEPTVLGGEVTGIDGQPFLSEVVLHIHYQGLERRADHWVMKWTFRLFAELWNLGSQPVDGVARLSYEVNLQPGPIGVGGPGRPFDDPQLLGDPDQSQHHLEAQGSRYFTPRVSVALLPDQYRFYEFARVDYAIRHDPQLDAAGQPVAEEFALVEPEDKARGLSLVWNGVPVQRLDRIIRDAYGLSSFRTDRARKAAKACIPGLNYGSSGQEINNMGDPRIAGFLKTTALGENAYPENASPHRRNIRRRNIYDKDPDPRKTRHYGRVLPSQWPDGGHDSATGNFYVTTSDAALPTDESKWPMSEVPEPLPGNAPQRISNAGRFFSATELGRVFDPVMWLPVYPDLEGEPGSGLEDTQQLIGDGWVRPAMPVRRMAWPEVARASLPSPDHGGGNTLRIGRPEHERFDQSGWRASRWLDLFHAGISTSADASERAGPVVRVHGRVNINTAGRDVLRCLATGAMGQDPLLSRVTDWNHDTGNTLAAVVEPVELHAPADAELADKVADAIIDGRPFASPSELAELRDRDGMPVFGERRQYEASGGLQWSDAAAEELFARVYEASTVRSRHFRIWVVGQSLGGPVDAPEVLAEYRRVFTVFIDPGEREADGRLIPGRQRIRVLYEKSF